MGNVNEKDRALAQTIRSECFVDVSQTERPCFEWDVDTAAAAIAKYCADAVKEERKRLDKKIRGALCNSPNIFVTSSGEVIHLDEACKIVRSAILSDDQEDHRG